MLVILNINWIMMIKNYQNQIVDQEIGLILHVMKNQDLQLATNEVNAPEVKVPS